MSSDKSNVRCLGEWLFNTDILGPWIIHGVLLSTICVQPLALGVYVLLFAVALAADLVAGAATAAREAAKRQREEAEGDRKRRDEAVREQREAERRRKEDTERRRREAPEYKLAEAKRAYEQALAQIAADATLDPAERAAARDEAKRRYLNRLDEVM